MPEGNGQETAEHETLLPKERRKIWMRVSPAMRRLRDVQIELNHFLWTTEMSAAHASQSLLTADPGRKVHELWSEVPAQAWYPNVRQTLHHDPTVAEFLEQSRHTLLRLSRSVVVYFSSAFEHYLATRFAETTRGILVKDRLEGYRSILRPLVAPLGKSTIGLPRLLQADLIRVVRNAMVHDPKGSIQTEAADRVVRWLERVCRETFPSISEEVVAETARRSIDHVIGRATEKAAAHGLPVDYFYALFSLGNLSMLAVRIEEELGDSQLSSTWISGYHVPRNLALYSDSPPLPGDSM